MEKMIVVEMECYTGYRFWSAPMPASDVEDYILKYEDLGYYYSDEDLAAVGS